MFNRIFKDYFNDILPNGVCDFFLMKWMQKVHREDPAPLALDRPLHQQFYVFADQKLIFDFDN